MKTFVRSALERAPARARGVLSRAAFGAYQRYVAFRAPQPAQAGDGLSMPPPRLRVLVSGTGDPGLFLRSGALEATAMKELLARHSIAIAELDAILDFGCGCGRIVRHHAGLAGPGVYGCDYNDELVSWCQENLPFAHFEVNQLAPPLPFERRFDFIYALSVFTHLSESLQFAWIEHLRESLSPGGVLLFTTVGSRGAARLSPAERERFDRGELVVRFDESAGRNLCAVFHPAPFVRRMVEGLEVLETIDTGVSRVPTSSPLRGQDVHLVRRTSD